MRWAAAVWVASLLSLTVAPVSAQPLGMPAQDARLRAAVELGASGGGSRDASLVAFSPEVGLRWRVSDAVVADATFGLTLGGTHVRGRVDTGRGTEHYDADVFRVEAGNPVISGAYAGWHGPVRLLLGLALGVPTAARTEAGDSADFGATRAASSVTQIASASLRGWWAPWRWAPERASVALPLRMAIDLASTTIGVEAGLGLMFPVVGDRGPDVDVVMQLAAEVSVRVADGLALGLRAHVVGDAMGVAVPPVTVAVEPSMRVDLAPVQLSFRANVNVAGDDGIAGPRGPAFGILTAGSVDL